MNECQFSPCRKYRYVLTHRWHELLPGKSIAWIGLNPSTADEQNLDPTLRRIKTFSASMGANTFHMLNLFSFRATLPKDMKAAEDPIGPENDYWIKEVCLKSYKVVACWGIHGEHLKRDRQVMDLLRGMEILCLGTNDHGTPAHPLYLSKGSQTCVLEMH